MTGRVLFVIRQPALLAPSVSKYASVLWRAADTSFTTAAAAQAFAPCAPGSWRVSHFLRCPPLLKHSFNIAPPSPCKNSKTTLAATRGSLIHTVDAGCGIPKVLNDLPPRFLPACIDTGNPSTQRTRTPGPICNHAPQEQTGQTSRSKVTSISSAGLREPAEQAQPHQ